MPADLLGILPGGDSTLAVLDDFAEGFIAAVSAWIAGNIPRANALDGQHVQALRRGTVAEQFQ